MKAVRSESVLFLQITVLFFCLYKEVFSKKITKNKYVPPNKPSPHKFTYKIPL